MKQLIHSALMIMFAATSTFAADYYLKPGGMPFGVNWTNRTYWFTNPDGTGTNPASYPTGFTGSSFFTNGMTLRLNATTFPGNSIKMAPCWPDLQDELLMKHTSGTATIPILYSEGGLIVQGEEVTTGLQINTLNSKVGTTLHTAGAARGIDLSVGTLTGSGDIRIIGAGLVKFGATNASAYTGNLKWGTNEATQLEFTTDFTSGGKLVVNWNGKIKLHQNVTFKAASIGITPLTPGTHTFASLKAAFPAQFLDGGSGSITVQTLPGADLDLTGYQIIFRDEFDGPLSISNWGPGTKWIAHKPDGGDFGYGTFTYSQPNSNPYSIANGILSIRAWWNTAANPDRWHAGLLSSVGRSSAIGNAGSQGGYGFAQRYGYFECRMKFPNKDYAWPAFWLLSTGSFEIPQVRTAELDSMEWYGDRPYTIITGSHRWNFGPGGTIQQRTTVQDIADNYHVYGVMVTPEAISYYIDGHRVFAHPTFPEAKDPLYVLINYALHVAPPTTEQGISSYTDVDYVRVWEAPPSVTGLLPRSGYTINAASSQDPLNLSANAIDGNYWTSWTSAPNVPKPHEIKLDLGAIRTITGIRYLPRQSHGNLDGLIQNYQVLVSTNGTSWTTAATGTWSATPLEKTATFAAQNVRYISLKDVGTGTLTAAAELNVIGTVPPYVSVNINNPTLPGSTSENNGVFTIQASGIGITGPSDQFRFVYRQMTGDGQITARISSLTRVNDWSKGGIMMRESLTNNSKNAYAVMSAHGQLRHQWRTSIGGQTANTGPAATFPRWLRLVRVGNVFTSYHSTNGTTWTQLGTSAITMGSTIYVGMAVTSNTNSLLTTAVFDNVSW